MNATGMITMTMRELDRLKVIQAIVEMGLKPGHAAERLELTVRQVERLVTRYRESGAAGLASRKRGQASNHQLPAGKAGHVLALIRERYTDFGPTLACEKLHESHGIKMSVETVRTLMIAAGLWIPRSQRLPKIHQPRARRACFGELIQIDGSEHAWFEDRAPACTLLVYVDDATSRLMHLHFTVTESTFGYFEATRAYLERYGKPVAFYSDRASVFRPTHSRSGARGVTQFGRAMYELNIETWCANSSPAKGRVERAHLTLQDRLVKELRLRGIQTLEAANAYALSFMAAYNVRFAKPPRSPFNAHRPLRDDEDLDAILTWRVLRKVSDALTVLNDRMIYLLEDTQANRKWIGRYLEIWEYPDGRIEIRADSVALPYRRYDKLAEIDQGAIIEHKRLGHALQVAQALQAQRDSRRATAAAHRAPRRARTGVCPYKQRTAGPARRSRARSCQRT
jgi:transposase